MNNSITNFPINVYGKMEKFSDTISKGRCRVFYKGLNRNGTYITDEFAEKLIASAPYAPVKGIYEYDDYTDHGTSRDQGRIYGIIPADPNFAWEKHTEDGIEREYACFDVLYYTALYKEASEIEGKSESMELYKNTLKGNWQIMDGKKVFVFTDGCFLGLQALGDDVEPCFEGASFYSLESNITSLLEKYEKRYDIFSLQTDGGKTTMDTPVTFKVSDGTKFDILFNLLNPNFNPESGWEIECNICDIFDEYAIVYYCESKKYERVYYTKNDEENTVVIDRQEECFIIDVNADELEAVKTLKGNNETFAMAVEHINEIMTSLTEVGNALTESNNSLTEVNATVATYTAQIEELNAKIAEFENLNVENNTKFEEYANEISTLKTERDTISNTLNEVNNQLAEISAERDNLIAYKKEIETNAKKEVLYSYNEFLSEEVINDFLGKIDSYSLKELDMELTYAQKQANPNLFNKQEVKIPAYIPKDEDGERTLDSILARYEKK